MSQCPWYALPPALCPQQAWYTANKGTVYGVLGVLKPFSEGRASKWKTSEKNDLFSGWRKTEACPKGDDKQ